MLQGFRWALTVLTRFNGVYFYYSLSAPRASIAQSASTINVKHAEIPSEP